MSVVSQILADLLVVSYWLFFSFQLIPSRPSHLASVHFLWGRGKGWWDLTVSSCRIWWPLFIRNSFWVPPAPWIKKKKTKKVKLGLLNLNQIEVLNGHKLRTDDGLYSWSCNGVSVFNNENLERNLIFEALKASKLGYLYAKYLLYWMVYPVEDGHVICKIMATECMIRWLNSDPYCQIF